MPAGSATAPILAKGRSLVGVSEPRASVDIEADGSAAHSLSFEPGWDRQDRWLRFVAPGLEGAYREATTAPARRRLRVAAVVGCVLWASGPLFNAVFQDIPLGPIGAGSVLLSISSIIVVAAAAGRVGLRGLWGLACAVAAVMAICLIAYGGETDATFWATALGFAVIGIFLIAWVRVAWWVASVICLVGSLSFLVVGLARGGDGMAVEQAAMVAMILGGATLGNRALEAAERQSFAQELRLADSYHRVDRLFRSYLSPDVAQALVEDPARAELGGEIIEVSVLFADLRDYTPFAEDRSPAEVVAMLNTAFGAAVPAVFAEGGTIVSFVGDALMAIFNAPLRQPDHALRACRAGLALQAAVAGEAASSERPRFRVGINTGPALVGNVGSPDLRNFSALGDTTTPANRLQTHAPDGSVVIGERTYERVRDAAVVRALGRLDLKGKSAPTPVYELMGLREPALESADAGRAPGVAVPTG